MKVSRKLSQVLVKEGNNETKEYCYHSKTCMNKKKLFQFLRTPELIYFKLPKKGEPQILDY